jgi:cystathionine beta-lyase/cystathionine gamma-synthase
VHQHAHARRDPRRAPADQRQLLGRARAPQREIRERCLFLGLPAPLFTFDFEGDGQGEPTFSANAFKRFFDMLDPVFGHQVSLGQPNTVVLCPAITSHSEMSLDALREAGIAPTRRASPWAPKTRARWWRT